MINFYDVIAASEGITVADEFAALWGRKISGGYEIATYTGVLPVTLQTVVGFLESYRIWGNTVQTGTPTPENPIMPEGVGERTENLFDAATAYGNMYDSATGTLVGAASSLTAMRHKFDSSMVGVPITISIHADDVPVTRVYIRCTIGGTNVDSNSIANGKTGKMTVTVTPTSVNDGWRITFGTGAGDITLSDIMLNLGSTPLPYVPFGYKLPILSNSTITDIYLGEAETTRKIRKIEVEIERVITLGNGNKGGVTKAFIGNNAKSGLGLCSKALYGGSSVVGGFYVNRDNAVFVGSPTDTLNDFKSKYDGASLWYILATEETAVVNEPLQKIGDYADTIDSTQTTVQIPTFAGETTISYGGTGVQPEKAELKYRR